jgi:hypothetical protein
MTRVSGRAGFGLLVLLCALPCSAQEASLPATAATTETSITAAPAPAACCELPEGTPLVLEILDPISSARAKRGDAFRLRVRDDVSMEGVVVLPAGTEGVGEIVHAEPSRGGGKPGELILAARRLQLNDRELKLRGFKLGGAGKDTSGVALGVAVGIGPFAHFIHGKEIEIPALTTGIAKLAEPLRGPLPAGTAAPHEQAIVAPAVDAAPAPSPATPPNHLE